MTTLPQVRQAETRPTGVPVTLRDSAFGCEFEVTGRTWARIAEAVPAVVGGTVMHVGQPACYVPTPYRQTMGESGRSWRTARLLIMCSKTLCVVGGCPPITCQVFGGHYCA